MSRHLDTAEIAQNDKFKTSILNYVWINKTKINPTIDHPLCGVPLHYFDNAVKNANLYPDTEVIVWLDYKLLDDASKFFIESYQYLIAPKNMRLKY